jgi:hypothetical protein
VEKLGIPTMEITRKGFTGVVNNAFAGLGFPADAATIHEFPVEMFLGGSDLTPINENIDKVIFGLTKWQAAIQEKGIYAPPKVTVQGEDYEQAVANMNLLFLRNLWGDGLPILPPTDERVDWMLTGTDLARDKVIGNILPRGGIATIEQIAVSLAMAGGRPEYMPLLIAATQAMIEADWRHDWMNSTTCSVFPAVIVNGPVAEQIRLNSGYGCLGPDPVHPPGTSVGRALRFLLMDMGGGIPGTGTMAIYGANRSTNLVFAEDEEGLPADWDPLSVEMGFAEGSNVATVVPVASTVNMLSSEVGTQESAYTTLYKYAGMIGVPSNNYFIGFRYENSFAGMALMARGTAQGLAALGWSKADVKAFLWENSKIPWERALQYGYERNYERYEVPREEPLPIATEPEGIMIVVAGGEQSGHGYWLEVGHSGYVATSAEIELPANWDELLAQAEADLGPAPAR